MVHTFSISPHIKDWLIKEDPENPSIQFFTMRDLFDMDPGTREMRDAKEAIVRTGPVPIILANQHPEGYWEEPGPGYRPKYRSTVWSLIILAQLGADSNDPRVRNVCEYIFTHARAPDGYFSMTGTQSGTVHCLQGNLIAALIDLGAGDDPRLQPAIEWMARSVTGEGFGSTEERDRDPHYIRSGISGPGFFCSANDHQPCAWGAVKVGLALSKIPPEKRSQSVQKAVKQCVEFLLSVDPATAEYPHPYAEKASTSWFKYGFPLFYVTDLLQNLSVLLALGLGGDPRLENAMRLIESQQDNDGTWRMTYTYNGKTWVDIEKKNQPSKWITYRALTVLKNYFQ